MPLTWKDETPEDTAEVLRDYDDVLMEKLKEAVVEWTLLVEGTAKRLVPVDEGRLRSSIGQEVEITGKAVVTGAIGTNVDYAPHVAFGTEPHVIRGDPLVWKTDSGELAFATVVHHPGTEAQPFLRPAVEAHKEDLPRLVKKAQMEAVELAG